MKNMNRRQFVHNSIATTVGLAAGVRYSAAQAKPADSGESIRVGFIGVGNRGSQLLQRFLAQRDCKIVALCDVYEPYLNRDPSRVDEQIIKSVGRAVVPRMGEKFDGEVARYKDFRRVLDRKDVDAVVVATPDHWHAIQTIAAFDAGKDVYVEKPLSLTVQEGRRMVEAQQRHRRIAQVGLHRRSSRLYAQIREQIEQGKIGQVNVARAYRVTDMAPNGIGKYPDAPPPVGMDWDLWLGPRPMRSFRYNIAPYKFRWWQEYSSQVGNWGVHYFDAIRWMLHEDAPAAVSAHGGRFVIDDDRTIPDTMEVTLEFASGKLVVFGQYEANGGAILPAGEIELRGSLGNLYPGPEAAGYRIVWADRGQFQGPAAKVKDEQHAAIDGDLTAQHVRNFLDCVKSRKPCNCDLETGHRSTTFAHLANIALATRSRLEWDAAGERVTNNEAANHLLSCEYREPWKLA